MKVLVIDPWCRDEYEVYTIGFCEGMSQYVDLTLISNYYETRISNNYKIVPLFFKKSQIMKRSAVRQIIRGLEYIKNYLKILSIVRNGQFDVVHVQWSLFYKIDTFFLKAIKKLTGKLVYTSHNVIPHRHGEKWVSQLKKLHNHFDSIILHGDSIKKEYLQYFPEDEGKLVIQRHGVHLTQQTNYNLDHVSLGIQNTIYKYAGKKVTFVGGIFYNKGADLLIEIWKKHYLNSNNLLIVAGELIETYPELQSAISDMSEETNILYHPQRTSDDEFAYILSQSDIVVVPYRHASMSGIVFSAAAFKKPLLFTDTGSISEYVEGTDCIKVENTIEGLEKGLLEMMCMTDSDLQSIGNKLHHRIYNDYDWNVCCRELYNECYMK